MKTEKEYEQEIQSLNFLLLEFRDQINALTAERDKLKLIIEAFFKEIESQKQLYQRIK